MAGNLVTIATFDQPPKARLAHNALEAAGIRAVVTDETTVAMDWLLGNAVGWVKVQVLEEDAERAVTVLEESLGTGPVDEEELAAEAEAAGVEDDEPPERPRGRTSSELGPTAQAPAAATGAAPPTEGEEPATERDEYTSRMFMAAIFGLVVPLLWFYAVYLFLNAAFGEGPLSPRSRTKLRAGGVILGLGFFTAYYLFRLYGDPFW